MKKTAIINNIEAIEAMLTSNNDADRKLAFHLLNRRDKSDVNSEAEVKKLVDKIKPNLPTHMSIPNELIGYILIINGIEIFRKENKIIWRSKGGPRMAYTNSIRHNYGWGYNNSTKNIISNIFKTPKEYTKFLVDNGVIEVKEVYIDGGQFILKP